MIEAKGSFYKNSIRFDSINFRIVYIMAFLPITQTKVQYMKKIRI